MARQRGKIVDKIIVQDPDGITYTLNVRILKAERPGEKTTFRVHDAKLEIDVSSESFDEVKELAQVAAKAGAHTEWGSTKILIKVEPKEWDYEDAPLGTGSFGASFQYEFIQLGTTVGGEQVFRRVHDLEGADPGDVSPENEEYGKILSDSSWNVDGTVRAVIDGTAKNLAKCIELCDRFRALYDRLATLFDETPEPLNKLALQGLLKLPPISKTWIEKLVDKVDS